MAAATRERMIRLWAGPQGALKSALAGIQDPPLFSVRPGTQVPADVMTAGKTSVVWEGAKPVVTFPIPGVPGATGTATLDAKFMAEKVVVKDGTNTTEFTYSDYRDWNNPLHPAEAFVAGRMIERRNGTVVRDITTTLTETGQMYVVMPVPASVKAAIKPTLQPPNWVSDSLQRRRQRQRRLLQAVTPRLANGKPDMTGSWAWRRSGPTGWREPPLWSNAEPLRSPERQLRGGLCVDLALAVLDGPKRPRVQTRVLGQGPRDGHVDEQIRSDHDVPADGDSAPGRAPPHLPHGKRHHLVLYVQRLRRRKQGISHDPHGRPCSTIRTRRDRRPILATPWESGRATRWWSTPFRSSIRHGWDVAVSSIPATCASWRSSRARAMKSCTK